MRLTDEQLLLQIKNGNKSAFSELVVRNSKKYYRLAYRYLNSKQEAEDIVQAALLKLWEHPDQWQYEKGVKFNTWFCRVLINLALDKNKKKFPKFLDDIENQARSSLPCLDSKISGDQEQLEQAIKELPVRQQTALNLCFYEEFSSKEAAQIMHSSVSAVQALVMRAKYNLYKKLLDN
jgi:RNA polymerase sigma-70 factor (ECF subfamily)